MSQRSSTDYEATLVQADESFFVGDNMKAAELYSLLLEGYEKDSHSSSNSSWANDYFDSQLFLINQKIGMFPCESSYYLHKAAVYFFQNKWDEARVVLSEANTKCTDKTQIRHTIGQLNKLERKFDETQTS